MQDERIELGRSGVHAPLLGLGTWQWGDTRIWRYGQDYAEAEIEAAFDAALSADIDLFDTAEMYGQGRSERFLGQFVRGRVAAGGARPVIATKYMPYPWRLTRGRLAAALHSSLDRLGLAQVDLYQVHWPLPPRSVTTWAEALADVVEAGLARAVGVSNHSTDQMRRVHEALARRGVPLASNQVQYSLLHRRPEQNGLFAACRELGVTLIAYSPLAKGLLTGKYAPGSRPAGPRGWRYNDGLLAKIGPLNGLLRDIGQAHGKTPGQVSLNWLICRGALPIPGAKNARQAAENAGALGWRLNADEMAALEQAADATGVTA
ncbi:MAG: L-glyceraldehyde 3-phosphate reductase [Chloroflexi bacterium ADurb.Bin325]|nr:MAG: L-glyceraldehyde 3-phosphate reductase [Chloroflexi bacterium ADurb.Bin325]